MQNLILLLYYAVYLVAVFSAGSLFLRLFKIKYENNVEKMAFEFAAGNLVYSATFVYLGIFHLLYDQILLILYLFPTALRLRHFITKKVYTRLFNGLNKFWQNKWETPEIAIFIFLIIPFLILFPSLFVFPTSWDALAYHLPLPKIYLQDHFFSFYNWFPQTATPVGMEALFAYGEALREPRLSNFIVFSFLVTLVVYFTYGLRYLFSRQVLFLALLLFLFRRILFSEVSVAPFVDFPFACYSLIVVMTLLKFVKQPRLPTLVLIAIFGVYSFMFKYMLGFVVLFSLGMVLLWHLVLPKDSKNKLLKIKLNQKMLWGSVFCLFLFPVLYWLSRNYYYFQNPIYPVFNNIFKGFEYDETSYFATMADLKGGSLTFSMLSNFLLHLPINKHLLLESAATLPLIISPFIVLIKRRELVSYLAIFSLSFAIPVFMMTGYPSYRYILAVAPLLALVTSYLFWTLLKKPRTWLKTILALSIITILPLQLAGALSDSKRFLFSNTMYGMTAMLSYENARKLLPLQDNYFGIDYVNKNLDRNKDKVLITFDNRVYYFDVPVMYANPSINGIFTNTKNKTAEDIQKNMKINNITYVLINYNWGTHSIKNKDLYYSYVDEYLEPVASSSGTFLYKVK